MKAIRPLALAVLFCALAPSLAAAATPRTRLAPAASAGELVTVPGTPEKAELVNLGSSLADGLLRVQPDQEVAVAGWPVTVGGMEMPIWPSWVAFVVAAGLAWLGFKSKA